MIDSLKIIKEISIILRAISRIDSVIIWIFYDSANKELWCLHLPLTSNIKDKKIPFNDQMTEYKLCDYRKIAMILN